MITLACITLRVPQESLLIVKKKTSKKKYIFCGFYTTDSLEYVFGKAKVQLKKKRFSWS